MRTALIVIDMLNDFWAKRDSARKAELVASINELVMLVCGASCPVIWVRKEFEPNLSDVFEEMRQKKIFVTIKGTEGSQLLPGLAAEPSDPMVVKKRYSAFFGTDLDALLNRLETDTLILAGINTHACIRMTAIDAYQRDCPVILALNCIDSYDPEHHDMSMRYMNDKIASVRSNAEIRQLLDSDVGLNLNSPSL